MYVDQTKKKKIIIVFLLLYFFTLGLTTALVKFYQSKVESYANITSDNTEITAHGNRPNVEILGIYNSVTLTPTPINNPDNIAQVKNNSAQKSTNTIVQNNPVSIDKSEIYTLVNEYRKSKGLEEVVVDSRLETSSLNKANHMVTNNYFDHGNPWLFISDAGYKFKYASENLAVNYYSSSSIIRGWKESPSHNRAMLDNRNQHMGFAYLCEINISSYENTCLAVIHFGSEN
ncbi:MAG TPA: CAP domain-containing protein [Candidatus Dojkabacteria bacterium]|nr:CAP domain-containing protein [Candidatus Dojkabacteria bacterium]